MKNNYESFKFKAPNNNEQVINKLRAVSDFDVHIIKLITADINNNQNTIP